MSIVVRSNEKPVAETKVSKETDASASVESKESKLSAPESKDSEQKQESSESETEETEAKDSESEETESGDESETESKDDKDETTESSEKPKKKGGFQRRIDKLNARHMAAQQELEYWKQQALKGAGTSNTEQKVDAPKATASAEGKPNPDNFETHAQYVEALTDWKTEQKLQERDQKQERSKLESEHQKVVQKYVERRDAFAAKVEDFNDVISEVDDIPVSQTIREIILSSENGPELAYELAKNRDEYARVCKLSPIAAAREMGRIESRIADKSSAEKKPEAKKITSAPKPLEPVKAGGKGSANKSIFDPGLTQAEYERLRMEQNKKRRQA